MQNMQALKVYLCGPEDVQQDMDRVRDTVARLNGSLSHLVGVTLDVHCWKLEESGLDAQTRIFGAIAAADLVIFLFSRRLGRLTPREFDTALKNFFKRDRPVQKVWFRYVPLEFERDPSPEYKRLLDFKISLSELPPHGLVYHTYQSNDRIATPFSENTRLPSLETLVFQEFLPFLLRSTRLFDQVIMDEKRLPTREGITQGMITNHWKQRAQRPGVAAVMSSRYKEEQLQQASEELVKFVLKKTKHYVSDKSVIEFGSGTGRFTLHLSNLAKKLTVVDMCPQMTARARELMGEAWDQIQYIESFVEDLPKQDYVYDCAFSCLLFAHILDENNLRCAVDNVKASANTVILCEHIDETKQDEVSNFTRIWPRSTYQKLFGNDFEELEAYKYNYLGDNLQLMIFRRRSSQDELYQKAFGVLKHAQRRGEASFPSAWKEWYHLFQFANLIIPYEHLLGSYAPDAYEFSQKQVAIYRDSDLAYDLPEDISADEEEQLMREVEQAIVRKKDYQPKEEVKARIDKIEVREIDPIGTLPKRMDIHLRPVRYFHYLIVKKKLNEAFGEFRKKYTAYQPTPLSRIEGLRTTNIGGCGIFLLTRDNYVILSRREKVTEYPGVVSYSASGNMPWHYPKTDNFEADPFLTIFRETYEELGVRLDSEQLRLFAVGTDVTSFFIQFSFYARIPVTASEVMTLWQDAQAIYEQVPFAIPITPDRLSEIVARYSMEPAAAATLIQLSCKIFGYPTFEKNLKGCCKHE